ncbi:LPS export ABC transporter periplasmic protein LptC [Pelagibacteraceae bacterium]|nr:LPS export ABC transporter periplasmic protein LptC [Pelagibacteraceae bacterium]
MNFFLHINRNFIFFIGLIIIFIFFVIIIVKQISFKNIEIEISNTNLPDVDITEPKFAINNDSKKIYITAKEGNFLNQDEVLLKNNVKFKSNEFSIETEKVIFNRNNQTARSESKSFFKSENTSISSDGFNIYDNGNKIVFYGNSFIILK